MKNKKQKARLETENAINEQYEESMKSLDTKEQELAIQNDARHPHHEA